MEAKSADLSALRINRSTEPAPGAPGARRWILPAAVTAGIVAAVAVAVPLARRAFSGSLEVRLTPATLVSPGHREAISLPG
jgi:hypothetical protein